jgi:hypothetical protein
MYLDYHIQLEGSIPIEERGEFYVSDSGEELEIIKHYAVQFRHYYRRGVIGNDRYAVTWNNLNDKLTISYLKEE